ncbi:MAG TPA: DnaJ domain-containing protein [Candidatus Binatia bacterium]|jgi:DnaJ-class molecular chaperone|nr:DnaJ domain-containing protein [Candidatus Binatia bacterium]
MIKRDYYLILGVPRTESPSGIRAAFRQLAKRYHPERIGSHGARFFQEILTAYQVLTDPEKRRLYDQGLFHAEGRAAEQKGVIIIDSGTQLAPAMPEPIRLLSGFETICPPFEEILEQVLRNFNRTAAPREEPVRSFNVQVVLSPDEAARGGMALIKVPVLYPCPTCGGSGQEWLFPCSPCQGQGMLEEEETVRVPIPPLVRDYTVVEVPVRGLGIHNLSLRLYIRVVA